MYFLGLFSDVFLSYLFVKYVKMIKRIIVFCKINILLSFCFQVVSNEHDFLRGPEGVSSWQVEGSQFVQTCL